MAKVVLLRAANVGRHNRFRPSVLARELGNYDIVNIGAVGTFVVHAAVNEQELRHALLARLGFETEVIVCDGSDFITLAAADPFCVERQSPDTVRFVSVLSKPQLLSFSLPMHLPQEGDWYLKLISCHGRFLCGLYKRQMKTIRYLNQLEKLAGVPVTTRNWNTVASIVRSLARP